MAIAGHTSTLTRADYLDRACAGGYPEALTRPAGRRRAAWLDNYVQRIVERDAFDISALQHLDELPKLLRLLAARNAGELNTANLANDAGMPVRTLTPYLALLETLYVIQRVPAWSTNLSKRVVSRPKAMLLDTGGAEVDLILETDDGRVAGIEVKATSNVSSRDAKWLTQLRERLGHRFVGGVILHTGPTSAPFGDRIVAAPIDVLWTT